MSDWVPLSDLLFNILQDQHISMVVLLQELEVKSVTDLSSKNRFDLFDSLWLGMTLACQMLKNLSREVLVLIVNDIEGNLVCNKVVIFWVQQFTKEDGSGVRNVQEELALVDLEVVESAFVLSGLEDEHE